MDLTPEILEGALFCILRKLSTFRQELIENLPGLPDLLGFISRDHDPQKLPLDRAGQLG
jgi:hypothetical protein